MVVEHKCFSGSSVRHLPVRFTLLMHVQSSLLLKVHCAYWEWLVCWSSLPTQHIAPIELQMGWFSQLYIFAAVGAIQFYIKPLTCGVARFNMILNMVYIKCILKNIFRRQTAWAFRGIFFIHINLWKHRGFYPVLQERTWSTAPELYNNLLFIWTLRHIL